MSSENNATFFTKEISPGILKIIIIILFVLVFLSLGLNGFLISQLLSARQQALGLVQNFKPMVQDTLSQVDTELETFQESTLEFNVKIDQILPIDVEIPFNETVEVPINLVIPIEQQIQTTVMMDPFQAGLEIPVKIDVPISVEVPIDVVLPVTIDRTIPISTNVPINLDVPLAIEVSETDLVLYIEQVRQGIGSFNESLDQVAIGAGN